MISDVGDMEIELFWKIKIRFAAYRNTFEFCNREDPINFNKSIFFISVNTISYNNAINSGQ